MHSRIFQVSTEPISKSDYIKESDFWDHWFLHEVADYVNDDCNREDDIDWLAICERGYTVGHDNNGQYIIVQNKEEYFTKAFERFQGLLNKITKYDIQHFAQGIYEMWDIQNVYEEKYGFYIYFDSDLLTFDEFIRSCTENEKYYIGGTIDYHC